jgi:DNA mismatch endonuclease (patch repair protein)
VRPLPTLRREADIVFRGAKVAVFVNGCFWHGCEEHATWPKSNAAWWRAKIESNRRRDNDTDGELRRAGWIPVRVWEHEDPGEAAVRIETILREIGEEQTTPD